MAQSILKTLRKTLRKNLVLGLLLMVSSIFAQTGAKYLVIAHDNFVDAIKPLVEWKTKKGVLSKYVPLSLIGSMPSQIKTYIQNAYNTWNPRPEYILLVGSPEFLPSYNNDFDDYYADLTGNYQIELCIGRFHSTTLDQCAVMVAKTIGYEKSGTMHDSIWFVKGTTIVGEDNPPDPYYQTDSRYIRNLWLSAGYTHVDSFLSTRGNNATDVINAINNGRAFVVYRGQSVSYWWSPFNVDPDNTNNGYKLPIVVSGTCATMTLSPGEQMLGDDFLRAGTVQNPKGAVGFFGTTVIGSHISQYRGAVTRGFFQALYQDSIFTMGGAAKRGKFLMDSLFPNQTRYMEWNLLGDPELNVWTTKPRLLTVNHDSIVFLQPTDFQVSVSSSGSPVPRALVCVMMDSTVYIYNYTDNNGLVTLSFTPQHIGSLQVTVTARNCFPYEGTVEITPGNIPYLRYHHYTIDDQAGGNGDSLVNPGEMINLGIYLINSGTQNAYDVSARLSTSDQYVTITDSIAGFGDIAPGNVVSATHPYQFTVASNCYNNHTINFNLLISDNASHEWQSSFAIVVAAGNLVYNTYFLVDSAPGGNGDEQLGPAENAKIRLTLNNSGMGGLFDVYARLRTNSPYLVITDSFGYFGPIAASTTVNNIHDPFAVSAAPNLPRNYPIEFSLIVRGNGGTYTYLDELTFMLYTDQGQSTDPTGPDGYGYYCYDNTDINSGQAPTYDWLEIAPPGPGSIIPQITNSDAGIDTLDLPFTFPYYGQNYNQVTVSSNGFFAMGRTNYRWGYNSPIPDTSGPSAMIAPFWDDLNPNDTVHGGNGDIYQYFDAENHHWIFEFKDVAHYDRNSVRETFQAILLDPIYYQTPTGDGEILFQYQTVADAASNTVGIENYSETNGIQYLYNNNYEPTAAALSLGRAIRFTTSAPVSNSPWLNLVGVLVNDSIGGNNNRIPEPGENVQLVITLTNFGPAQAENVNAKLRNTDGNASVIDSVADFGTIPVQGQANNENQPYSLTVNITPSDTILDFNLIINANGYNTTQYFAIGLNGNPGILTQDAKFKAKNVKFLCLPNPFTKSTVIQWQLPESQNSDLEIQIFDPTGRIVTRLKPGPGSASNSSILWNGQDNSGRKLSSGIYFVTLSFKTKEGPKRLVKKITISH